MFFHMPFSANCLLGNSRFLAALLFRIDGTRATGSWCQTEHHRRGVMNSTGPRDKTYVYDAPEVGGWSEGPSHEVNNLKISK